ncbi:MAG: hypothetical protein GY749_06005 [Desulfobacteraceae bacterium]|nr:hypothetical protein [Desulfobacteraceae bacterium]
MKIFKTIFRLDFPPAYRILDKLGEYSELIHTKTDKEPFTKGIGNINLLQHSLSHTSKIGDDTFTINLDLKTFNSVIEFQDGLNIDKLVKVPLFGLADEIIEKLEDAYSSKYNRIGFRSFIISEKKEFNFIKLRDYIWNFNKTFGNALIDHFKEKLGIAISFESKSENEENIRFQLGPYQHNERIKYFSLKNEGMIFDIDIWQSNISVPKLKSVEIIRNYQKIYKDLVKKIELQISEALK